MKQQLILTAKFVLPPLLGAFGALLATMAPSYYAAVCGGFPLLGGA